MLEKDQLGNEWSLRRGRRCKSINEKGPEVFQMCNRQDLKNTPKDYRSERRHGSMLILRLP